MVVSTRIGSAAGIRLAGGLTAEVREDSLLVRPGGAVVKVLPHEVRHLVDALVEGRGGVADSRTGWLDVRPSRGLAVSQDTCCFGVLADSAHQFDHQSMAVNQPKESFLLTRCPSSDAFFGQCDTPPSLQND